MMLNVVGKDLRAGRVVLLLDTLDDVWHVKHILERGDLVEALTSRRDESQTDKLRQERGEKRRVVLGVRVRDVEFHDFSDRLRVSGLIESGPMGKGSHHTINLEPGDRVTIWKEKWPGHLLERIDEAVKASGRPSVLILSIEEGSAVVAALRHFGVQRLAEISGVQGGGKQYRSSRDDGPFFAEVLDELSARREGGTPLVVLGPGFTKEEFMRYSREKRPETVEGAAVLGTGQAGMAGIYEAMKEGAISAAAHSTRVEEETRAVEALLEAIGKDGPATYGAGHVRKAADAGAVELLLVFDGILRDPGVDGLMETVQKGGGRCLVVSGAHDGGKKLEALGGLGAMLRYRK